MAHDEQVRKDTQTTDKHRHCLSHKHTVKNPNPSIECASYYQIFKVSCMNPALKSQIPLFSGFILMNLTKQNMPQPLDAMFLADHHNPKKAIYKAINYIYDL